MYLFAHSVPYKQYHQYHNLCYLLLSAINELKAAITAVPTVSFGWTGTASSTGIRKQQITIGSTSYDIDGTAYMEQSVQTSTSDSTLVTFIAPHKV